MIEPVKNLKETQPDVTSQLLCYLIAVLIKFFERDIF